MKVKGSRQRQYSRWALDSVIAGAPSLTFINLLSPLIFNLYGQGTPLLWPKTLSPKICVGLCRSPLPHFCESASSDAPPLQGFSNFTVRDTPYPWFFSHLRLQGFSICPPARKELLLLLTRSIHVYEIGKRGQRPKKVKTSDEYAYSIPHLYTTLVP